MYEYGTRYTIFDRKSIWRIIYECLLYGMCNMHVSPLWAINKLIVCQNYFCKHYKFLMNFNLFFETIISYFLIYLRYTHRHHHHSPLIVTNYFKRFGLKNWRIIVTNVNLFSLLIWLFDNIKRFGFNHLSRKYK